MKRQRHNLFLIDGNSLCYRAFYAIPRLSTSKGLPTNAVYGVISMIRKIIKEHSPGSMAAVFDLPGKTARHEKYESYKENRPPMPDELSLQMEKIKDVIKAYRIPVFERQGYEADDVIATLTRKARKKGFDVTIVTGDKDLFQLVDEDVRVLSPKPSGDTIYDVSGVREKFGVYPSQMADLLALMGDSSDNVPGVRGIGKVTARNLINQYGDLESIYRDIENVTPASVREKLKKEKDMAVLSRSLVVLAADVPVDGAGILDSREDPDNGALREIFREMEFTKLLREMDPPKKDAVSVEFVSSEKELEGLFASVKKAGRMSLKLDSKADAYAVCFAASEVHYVDLKKGADIRLAAADFLKKAAELSGVVKIAHDIKSEMRILDEMGIQLKQPFFDIMVADYLVDPSYPGYALDDIAARRNYDIPGSVPSGPGKEPKGFQFMEDDEPKDIPKFCRMCDAAFLLYKALKKELEDRKLEKLFSEVEMPLVNVLYDMESAGVGIDIAMLKRGAEKIEAGLRDAELRAYELAGEKFNMNSPKQIQVVLYDKLGLPRGKKIKTGMSTDESALKKLSSLHELPATILEYRRLSKLKTGYYDSILAFADIGDGVLHAKFNQAVTATGRLSSSEPNLQNIPVKTEVGREIRGAFRSRRKGGMLVAADYSQVELRVLAHLSEDEGLLTAFREKSDVHVFTAARIFGCEEQDVTDEMRSSAKTVNFGIIYGMGSYGLAAALGISHEKAGEFISAYFDRYRGVKKFIDRTIEKTRKDGYVLTLFNRRRYLPGISSANERVKSFAQRAAVNTAVQGTAADIIKMAMIKCAGHFQDKEADMIIQVHDELVFDVPSIDVTSAATDIKAIMEGVVDLMVPLEVNVEFGPNWRDMEEVEL
jgi:DNA polymerase I